MAQGTRGTDGGSDGSVLPWGSHSGDGDHFFHPVPPQGAVDQRLSLSLVQLAVTKPGRGRERVNTGRLLAGAAGSGSQLHAHARLLAALPGDRSLPACICCGATRFVPLLPPLAASHQHPGPSQGNDSPARPRSPRSCWEGARGVAWSRPRMRPRVDAGGRAPILTVPAGAGSSVT